MLAMAAPCIYFSLYLRPSNLSQQWILALIIVVIPFIKAN